jgi:thiamine-monophosphate kinase
VKPAHRDESAWVDHIRALFGASAAEVGIGDDACVLPAGRYAVTTDTLVEGADFELAWAPPEAVGHKALAANLSDLAAMGAEPRYLLLTLGWPEEVGDGVVEALLRGVRDLCASEGVGLCGGDLTRAPRLMISMTLLGEQRRGPLLRTGGRPGDFLYVSGSLGGPAAALGRFEAGESLTRFHPSAPPAEEGQRVLDRFFRPPGQVALGRYLAESGAASCCMDLSDGLSRDLGRLCEASGCGAEVEEARMPLDPALAGLVERDRLRVALRGGEEQILLFAVPPEKAPLLDRAPAPLFQLGRLRSGTGIEVLRVGGEREALALEGFDHFRP